MLGGLGPGLGQGPLDRFQSSRLGVGARGPVKHAKNAGERASLKQLEREACRPHMSNHDGGLGVVGDLTALQGAQHTPCQGTFCFYVHPHRMQDIVSSYNIP